MSKHLVEKTLKLMTVKEVADVFGVTSEAIKKWVRELFPEKIKNGVTTYLTEAEVTEIKLNLRPTTKVVASKTNLEKELIIQQAMQFQQEKINLMEIELQQANNKLLDQAPKVEFYDTVVKTDDWRTFKEVANILAIPELGRNNLMKQLRDKKYLTQFNKPYQRYIDQKLFKVVESVHGKKVFTSTVVSQKGVDRLIKEFK